VALPNGSGDSAIGVATQKESLMPEKSPQKPAGKKAGKSLKEKREAKRDKKENKAGFGR
jgi:hypothetical protein